MLAHSSVKSASRGLLSTLLAMLVFLAVSAWGQATGSQSDTPPKTNSQPTAPPTSQQPPPAGSPSAPAPMSPPKTGSPSTPAPPLQPPPKTGSRSTGGAPPALQQPPTRGGHPAETNAGRIPHSSDSGAAIGAAIGAAAAGVIIAELIAHHNASPERLGHDGPQVPKEFDMSGFVIKGLVHPNWPVVLDFMIDSPGSVQMDIIANKQQYRRR